MEPFNLLNRLPSELRLQICSYLPVDAVAKVGMTCRNFYLETMEQSLWRGFCQNEFPLLVGKEWRKEYIAGRKIRDMPLMVRKNLQTGHCQRSDIELPLSTDEKRAFCKGHYLIDQKNHLAFFSSGIVEWDLQKGTLLRKVTVNDPEFEGHPLFRRIASLEDASYVSSDQWIAMYQGTDGIVFFDISQGLKLSGMFQSTPGILQPPPQFEFRNMLIKGDLLYVLSATHLGWFDLRHSSLLGQTRLDNEMGSRLCGIEEKQAIIHTPRKFELWDLEKKCCVSTLDAPGKASTSIEHGSLIVMHRTSDAGLVNADVYDLSLHLFEMKNHYSEQGTHFCWNGRQLSSWSDGKLRVLDFSSSETF